MSQHWSEHYETGNHEIDHHHRELFQLTSLMDSAIQTGNTSYLEDIVKFLEHYVVDHFSEEEALMKKYNFKGLAHHQQEHQQFKESVTILRHHFNKIVSKTHVMFSIRKIVDELICHIIAVDSKIKTLEVKNEKST